MKHTVRFKEWDCSIHFGKYADSDRTAIILRNARPMIEDGILHHPGSVPIAVATVNMPNVFLKDKEIIIKNWSETEGILRALVNASIISKPKRTYVTGFVSADICDLLVDPEYENPMEDDDE
jgi:hypothetical protein